MVSDSHAIRTQGEEFLEFRNVCECALKLWNQNRLFGFRQFSSSNLLQQLAIPPPGVDRKGNDEEEHDREDFVEFPRVVPGEPGENPVEDIEPCRNSEDEKGKQEDDEKVKKRPAS